MKSWVRRLYLGAKIDRSRADVAAREVYYQKNIFRAEPLHKSISMNGALSQHLSRVQHDC